MPSLVHLHQPRYGGGGRSPTKETSPTHMAQGHTQDYWEQTGREAILDLLQDRFVAPWSEIEARIAVRGWKDYPKVQPLQLTAARKRLRADRRIIEEATRHPIPVRTIRLPFPPRKKRELARLCGSRRKKYRPYLSWSNNQDLCGKHAEKVVLESAKAAASDAGLYVPPQSLGEIASVNNVPLQRGPLDVLAHILELPAVNSQIPLVMEVKNIHDWIYPSARPLWEFLVKAAELAARIPIMPVIVCVRSPWTTSQMAKDIGFLTYQMRHQIFSPAIHSHEFDKLVCEFGLVMIRHDGPLEPIVTFLTTTLRSSPPPTPPDEQIPWYKRQAHRFQVIAPVILAHDALAGSLLDGARGRVFSSFRASAKQTFDWPSVRGW